MRIREKRGAVKSFCRNIFGLIDKRDEDGMEEDVVKLVTIGGRDVSQVLKMIVMAMTMTIMMMMMMRSRKRLPN